MAKHSVAYLTFIEVCESTAIPRDILIELIEHGLIHEVTTDSLDDIRFDLDMLAKIESASRLHQDLEVNASGIVLVLELLERLKTLQDELHVLRRHVE